MTTSWRRELPSLLLLAVMLVLLVTRWTVAPARVPVWRGDPDKVPPAGTLPGDDA